MPLPAAGDLTGVETVEDLRSCWRSAGRRRAEPRRGRAARDDRGPAGGPGDSGARPLVASLGRTMLDLGQKVMFGGVFDVKVTGKAYMPQNGNFLVIANHAQPPRHGTGEVRAGRAGQAAWPRSPRATTSSTRRSSGRTSRTSPTSSPWTATESLRESLRLAGEALQNGYNLLIFPEGTRSPDGQMREFNPTLGYLALTCGVDILPLYIQGAYEALPKGRVMPKQTEISVRIGPALGIEELRRRARGLARSESYRLVTRIAEEAVKRLREGGVFWLEPDVELAPAPVRPRKSSGGGPR